MKVKTVSLCSHNLQDTYSAHVKSKNEIKIILFDTCRFTTYGLSILSKRFPTWKVIGIPRTKKQLEKLCAHTPVDIIICGIDNREHNLADLLNIPDYPIKKSILLTNHSSTILQRTFTATGFSTVLSKSETLNNIAQHIHATLENCQVKKNNRLFTHQERYILGSLMRGESAVQIALNLGISTRTLSRHKQNALKRAGVQSLNDILASHKTVLT